LASASASIAAPLGLEAQLLPELRIRAHDGAPLCSERVQRVHRQRQRRHLTVLTLAAVAYVGWDTLFDNIREPSHRARWAASPAVRQVPAPVPSPADAQPRAPARHVRQRHARPDGPPRQRQQLARPHAPSGASPHACRAQPVGHAGA